MSGDDAAAALDAFGLLADDARLRVAGSLVGAPGTTDQLVAWTGLPKRRVLEALTRLETGGLVRHQSTGTWAFDIDRLRVIARAARPKPPPDDVGDVAPDAAAVLRRFLREGRLLSIPTQRSRRLVVLDHVARVFEPGVHYSEKQVNTFLRAFHDDVASLRRYLVDEHFLGRDHGVYWRTGGSIDV